MRCRGALKPGDRLPPQRDLAFRLGVTTGTVTRAYAEAEKMGLLSGEVGRGSYLKAPSPAAAPFPPLRRGHRRPDRPVARHRPAGDGGRPNSTGRWSRSCNPPGGWTC